MSHTPRAPQGRLRRALTTVAAAIALALGVGVGGAGAAHAVDYRYWNFYQLKAAAWAFATVGAGQAVPADGAVDGWRFAVTGETSSRLPRAVLTFEDICAATPAEAGKKRVGVVLDFGRAADHATGATPPPPGAACAVVDPKASSVQVLAALGNTRVEKGLFCAFNGYPATGCGDPVAAASAEANAADTPTPIPVVAASALGAPVAATATAPSVSAPSPGNQAMTKAEPTSSGASATTWVAILAVAAAIAAAATVSVRRRRSR